MNTLELSHFISALPPSVVAVSSILLFLGDQALFMKATHLLYRMHIFLLRAVRAKYAPSPLTHLHSKIIIPSRSSKHRLVLFSPLVDKDKKKHPPPRSPPPEIKACLAALVKAITSPRRPQLGTRPTHAPPLAAWAAQRRWPPTSRRPSWPPSQRGTRPPT